MSITVCVSRSIYVLNGKGSSMEIDVIDLLNTDKGNLSASLCRELNRSDRAHCVSGSPLNLSRANLIVRNSVTAVTRNQG